MSQSTSSYLVGIIFSIVVSTIVATLAANAWINRTLQERIDERVQIVHVGLNHKDPPSQKLKLVFAQNSALKDALAEQGYECANHHDDDAPKGHWSKDNFVCGRLF